jgi:hypothetical protein
VHDHAAPPARSTAAGSACTTRPDAADSTDTGPALTTRTGVAAATIAAHPRSAAAPTAPGPGGIRSVGRILDAEDPVASGRQKNTAGKRDRQG